MTKLWQVVDKAALSEVIAKGHVVRRSHPDAPLHILNYTQACQWEPGAWNAVTTACRGIIYHADTLDVLARPFRKFFNYGQREAPALDLQSRVTVTDKLDGSLGILYPYNGGHAIATRGAFDSEQARHATQLWNEIYAAAYCPPAGLTLLFEIIYPDNRIVLDYGDRDDLVLLGAVEIATGESLDPYSIDLAEWPGPRASLFECATLADALALPPRPNAEGVVIHLVDDDERVKVKQDDYVRLHRIVTGLNERTVWEHLKDGGVLSDLLESLPDEFHEWTADVAARLTIMVNDQAAEIEQTYADTLAALPHNFSRKDFALAVAADPMRWALFSRLDGKDYRPKLWHGVRPEGRRGPNGLAFSEDTA